MKSPPKEGGIVQRVFFEIHPRISNNISVSTIRIRVNIREIKHDTTFPLIINL